MNRVLVIFPGALGDLVCLTPSLWAIRNRYRNLSLELMAREELVRLAIRRLGVNCGLSIDRREVSALFIAGAGGNPPFAGYQRIFSFFAADNSVFRANLTAAAGGAEVTFHPFRPPGDDHVAIANLTSIGLGDTPLDYRVRVLDEDLGAAEAMLVSLGIRPHRFVAVFPGSGSAAKNWPLDRFVALAHRISRTIPMIFIAGPAEAGMIGHLRASGFPMLSGLELPVVAAIASHSRMFIGNDSGVSHLAAAAGAPGIVLFGPSPARFRPLGLTEVIERSPLDRLLEEEVAAAIEAKLSALG